MVITQEPTQPLATLHGFLMTRFRDPTEQQDVGLPLMIPLSMVMRNIFAQRPPQGALTKENDLRQTLLLQPMSANGMVRPCSCPASVLSWPGAPKTRSTPCLRNSIPQSP